MDQVSEESLPSIYPPLWNLHPAFCANERLVNFDSGLLIRHSHSIFQPLELREIPTLCPINEKALHASSS
jgi:hypothetical protein